MAIFLNDDDIARLRLCRVCGRKFVPQRQNAKYCSPECRRGTRAQREARAAAILRANALGVDLRTLYRLERAQRAAAWRAVPRPPCVLGRPAVPAPPKLTGADMRAIRERNRAEAAARIAARIAVNRARDDDDPHR